MPKTFSNTYYALRHGISVANEQQLIVSDPANGVNSYDLSENGRMGTLSSLSSDPILASLKADNVIVYSSDFLRAIQTAEILCDLCSLQPPVMDSRLRERNFGTLELTSSSNYTEVWRHDAQSMLHQEFGVESVASVQKRLCHLLEDLETCHSNMTIVLSSHGDTLQILQTIFADIPAHHHRSLPHLNNAELRLLNPVKLAA